MQQRGPSTQAVHRTITQSQQFTATWTSLHKRSKTFGRVEKNCWPLMFWKSIKVAESQKVLLLCSHCQQKVPNHSHEQRIWIIYLPIWVGNSNFWFRKWIATSIGNGTQVKIPSENKPSLINSKDPRTSKKVLSTLTSACYYVSLEF